MFKDAKVKLNGVIWDIKFKTSHTMPVKKTWGYCVPSELTIYVRKDLSLKNVVDTLIHEMRHAQHPVYFEAEQFINWSSTELADGLQAVGIIK